MERTAAPATASPAPRRAPVQGRGEAALERDAERHAAEVLSLGAFGSGAAQVATPRTARAPATAGGAPLPPALRQRFEPHFGVDFAQVRVHDDAASQALVRSRGALASTWGADIHVAATSWQAGGADALVLLAHELAHVAQHAQGAPLAWRDKPDPQVDAITPAVKSWYQEALDNVALSRKRMADMSRAGDIVIEPHFYRHEVILLELCEAVDAGDKSVAKKKVGDLLEAGLGVGENILSRRLLTELTARLFDLGLDDDKNRLRAAYAQHEKVGPHDVDIYAQRRRLDYIERLVSGARAATAFDTAATIAASMRGFARVYGELQRYYIDIDFDQLREEARLGLDRGFTLRPQLGRREYYHAVRDVLGQWHEGWAIFMQQAIDGVRADLEAAKPDGSGATRLGALRTALVDTLRPVLFSGRDDKGMSREVFEISKTEISKPGSGRVVDVFDAAGGAAAPRSVPVTTYDPTQAWAAELRAGIDASYERRAAQIHQLGLIYGVTSALQTDTKDAAATQRNEEAARANARSISASAIGRLRLDNDDDWRQFLKQKFADLTRPPAAAAGAAAAAPMSKADALKAVVELLFGYMRAFTVHARYTNLYDTGLVPYFNRPFPRALTGQLVHDCGVYAMRVAYILSLVRQELALKFWFVRLPAHVSLVINGDAGSSLPTFVIENDHYKAFDADVLADNRQRWQQFQNPDGSAAPGKADDTQFIGEMATTDFIGGPIDMPFRVSAVPAPGGASPKVEQQRLWADYQASVNPDVFGRSSQKKGGPNENFHLRYLALIEDQREFHNVAILPFWNEAAPPLWDAFVKRLSAPPAAGSKVPGGSVASTELAAALAAYETSLRAALAPLQGRLDTLNARKRGLSDDLRADPGLAKAGVRYASGLRASADWSFFWELHLRGLAQQRSQVGTPSVGQTAVVAGVITALQPRWVPSPEKALGRLD